MTFTRIASGIFAVMTLLFCAHNSSAATNEPQMLFLHLQMKDNRVSLLESSASHGVVKRELSPESKSLQYELLSASGEVLWKGGLNDPSVKQVEYEDPPRSGRLKRKAIPVNNIEFTIRLPLISTAQRVEFFRFEPESEVGKKAVRKSVGIVPMRAKPSLAP